MTIQLLLIATSAAAISAMFAIVTLLRVRQIPTVLRPEQLAELLRGEVEHVRQFGEAQSRGLREELGGGLRGFQDSTLKAFRELGDALGARISEFGMRMDAGVKSIDDRSTAIAKKLDDDIAHLGEEAANAREVLRHTIEVKLDDTATKTALAAADSRQEMIANFQRLGSGVANTLSQLGEQQKERLDNVGLALRKLTDTQERAQEALRQTVEQRLDAIRTENAGKLEEMRKTVDEKLQSTLEARLGELACTRFRRHRVRCFYGTGGESWTGGSLHGSLSLRLCG